uniref:Uncharacterized protein n=1 Tax=Graphocephala atropunctata TaxID=36148 RepID=A0A1B6M4Q4_9HEMI
MPKYNISVPFEFKGLHPMDETDEFGNFQRSKRIRKTVRKNLFSDGPKRPSLFMKTKQVLSSGIFKMNEVFNRVLLTVESATQSLRFNHYKRYDTQLDDYNLVPSAFQTPSRIARNILGRTPIKLYSPFDIVSCQIQLKGELKPTFMKRNSTSAALKMFIPKSTTYLFIHFYIFLINI